MKFCPDWDEHEDKGRDSMIDEHLPNPLKKLPNYFLHDQIYDFIYLELVKT